MEKSTSDLVLNRPIKKKKRHHQKQHHRRKKNGHIHLVETKQEMTARLIRGSMLYMHSIATMEHTKRLVRLSPDCNSFIISKFNHFRLTDLLFKRIGFINNHKSKNKKNNKTHCEPPNSHTHHTNNTSHIHHHGHHLDLQKIQGKILHIVPCDQILGCLFGPRSRACSKIREKKPDLFNKHPEWCYFTIVCKDESYNFSVDSHNEDLVLDWIDIIQDHSPILYLQWKRSHLLARRGFMKIARMAQDRKTTRKNLLERTANDSAEFAKGEKLRHRRSIFNQFHPRSEDDEREGEEGEEGEGDDGGDAEEVDEEGHSHSPWDLRGNLSMQSVLSSPEIVSYSDLSTSVMNNHLDMNRNSSTEKLSAMQEMLNTLPRLNTVDLKTILETTKETLIENNGQFSGDPITMDKGGDEKEVIPSSVPPTKVNKPTIKDDNEKDETLSDSVSEVED